MFLIAIFIEPLLFPEEQSRKKCITRILMCGIVITMMNIPFFSDVLFFNKLLTFILSYFSTSVIINSPFILNYEKSISGARTTLGEVRPLSCGSLNRSDRR